MYGQLSFKAIVVGLLVKFFSGAILGGIAGGAISAMMMGSMMRGGGNALARTNPAQITQMMATIFTSPLFIVATTLAAVLSALLGGYVTGLLAPGSEIKNAAVAVAIFAAWTLITTMATVTMTGTAAAPLAASMASLRWLTVAANLLSIPAYLGGAALVARRNAPSPRYDNFPQ